jgi:hypothetical protein
MIDSLFLYYVSIIDGTNSLFVLIVGRTRLNDDPKHNNKDILIKNKFIFEPCCSISDTSLSLRMKFFVDNLREEEYFRVILYHSGVPLRSRFLSFNAIHI